MLAVPGKEFRGRVGAAYLLLVPGLSATGVVSDPDANGTTFSGSLTLTAGPLASA